MSTTIRPLYDRVLIKRLESEQMSAGGIYIPDTAKEKTQMGAVVATGEGKMMSDGSIRPLQVKAGDKILFGKYSGTEFTLGSEEFLVLREEELLGVIEK